VRGLHNLRPRHHGSVVTIGNYDGLHIGHQAMLRALRQRADEYRVPSTVMCFEPSPQEFFAGSSAPARLSRFREKVHNLAAFGVDRMLCARFDEHIQSASPEDFVKDLLIERLGAKWIVIGNDFKFARGRAGNAALLRQLGKRYDFGVDEISPYCVDGIRVSSSLVRETLAAGNMPRAAQLLGRPYRMFGKVVGGQQLGRKLGYPTANLRLHRRVIPFMGIFAVRVAGAGLVDAPAVASLGTRPVINGTEPLLEVHLFDFDGDLYGKNLHVDFVARLRDELPFPNLDLLVEQIHRDAQQAREILK
jgi:riboflavin kinase / FMN adenylyltransferase